MVVKFHRTRTSKLFAISVFNTGIFFLFSALIYKYIVEQQPVGHKLFWQFCQNRPDCKVIEFLDDVVSIDFGNYALHSFIQII